MTIAQVSGAALAGLLPVLLERRAAVDVELAALRVRLVDAEAALDRAVVKWPSTAEEKHRPGIMELQRQVAQVQKRVDDLDSDIGDATAKLDHWHAVVEKRLAKHDETRRVDADRQVAEAEAALEEVRSAGNPTENAEKTLARAVRRRRATIQEKT